MVLRWTGQQISHFFESMVIKVTRDYYLASSVTVVASYSGLPSRLFLQPWKNHVSCEKRCKVRPGYEVVSDPRPHSITIRLLIGTQMLHVPDADLLLVLPEGEA